MSRLRLRMGVPIQDVKVPGTGWTKQAAAFRFAELGSKAPGDPVELLSGRNTPDGFHMEAGVGVLMLKPNTLNPLFWRSPEFASDRLSEGSLRMIPSNWDKGQFNLFKTKNVAGTTSVGGSPPPFHTPLVPSYEPLHDFLDTWAPDCCWVMETEEPLHPNEGISVTFGCFGTDRDTPTRAVVLGLDNLAWIVYPDASISMFRRTEGGKWRRLGTLAYGGGADNDRVCDTLTILPVYQDHFAFYMSTATVDNERKVAALYTGNKGTTARGLSLHDCDPDFEPTWDPVLGSWIKHTGGTLAIGVMEEGAAVQIGVNRVRYPAFSTCFLQPEHAFQFSGERSVLPTLQTHAFINGGALDVTLRDKLGSAIDANTNPTSFRIRMDSGFSRRFSPELAAVTINWPTEFLTPADATEDISDKWQLVRFGRTKSFEPQPVQMKLWWGRTADNLERLEQPPRSVAIDIRNDADSAWVDVVRGFFEEARTTPHGGGGLFGQYDGYSLTARAFERQLGLQQAGNGMAVGDFLKLALGIAGWPPDKIVVTGIVAQLESGELPEDWFTVLASATPAQAVRYLQELFLGYLVVREVVDEVWVYRQQTWNGVEPDFIFTDSSEILGGLTYAQRMALPQRILKIRSLPEFATVGAKAHRVVAVASSGVGEGERHGVIMQADDRAWTDETYADFEGRKKVAIISPPRAVTAGEGGLRLATESIFLKSKAPERHVRFEGEYHYSVDVDAFVRLLLHTEDGVSDRGIWNIQSWDCEVEVDANDYDIETWRSGYWMIKEPGT